MGSYKCQKVCSSQQEVDTERTGHVCVLVTADTQMTEHPTKAKEVLEIFEEVALRRREAEIVR
jgi:hypothetical protein